MMLSPEDRLAALEKQFQELSRRVSALEYAKLQNTPYQPAMPSPVFTPGTIPQWPIPGLPVTCDSQSVPGVTL